MRLLHKGSRRAFSLIELIIVLVIIGVLAAIAIPRMSRGAEGAADTGLIGSLAVVRSGIDLYAAEHTGAFPTFASFVAQMTTFTDDLGATSVTKGGAFIYGPYLRNIPVIPLGPEKGQNGVGAPGGLGTVAWIYDDTTGEIIAGTTTEADVTGTLYNTY